MHGGEIRDGALEIKKRVTSFCPYRKARDMADPAYEISKDMYVKLISSDGHEFYIKRDLALISQTIKAMLSGPGQYAENETNVIHFRSISSQVSARSDSLSPASPRLQLRFCLVSARTSLTKLDIPTQRSKYQNFPSHQI